ncbi:hypothetical protein F1D05_30685 [Kribbella qitaiheensis]|uniref:Uncharacterized protein n=1 Tax=Kribbella qitaiheensis TaxID=1544730 RepID=A0A7G6X5H2_9ACTN|nr:hypothetical protein [Kribbella qitaiheensis]QNE21487.1 hypothetical protein F1D05_30685 [Kribbella qitaiheensis]
MWPGLESARIAWAAARERIAELGATDEERRALVPVLRRKAVLDGARPQLGRDSDLKLIPLFLLWIGLPTVTMILAGRELTVSNLIRIHLLYLLFVLVVAFVVGTIALGMGTVWSEGWPNRGSVITSVLIAVTTAGLIVLFNQLRRSEAVLPGAVFAATVLVLAITLTTVAGIVRTDAKRRRAVGAQGLNHTAALVLVDEWHLLRENRPYWRRPVIRRHLLARLAALEEVVPLRIDRSVRANSDDGPRPALG